MYGSIAYMPKLTFSLDAETVDTLRRESRRTGKPQSQIVREAIALLADREDRLAPDDRIRLLGLLRRIGSRPPTRPQAGVSRELDELRKSRRTGWSRPVR
jgi:hypothetical protein